MKYDITKMNNILKCIFDGKTIREIEEITGYSESTIHKYIASLNKEDANTYNPKLFKKVKERQEETSKLRNKLGGMIGKSTSNLTDKEKINIALDILKNNMTIEETSIKNGIPKSTIHDNIRSIDSSYIQSSLDEMFDNHAKNKGYEFAKKGNVSLIKLYDVKSNVKREIALMALTYHVSFDLLAKLFDTTLNDVESALANTDLNEYLLRMNESIQNADDYYKEIAFNNALEYWKKRNKILREISDAKKNEDKKKLTFYKVLLKRHRMQIEDTEIKKIIKKGDPNKTVYFSDEDKEKILRYRLKYFLAYREILRILNAKQILFNRVEEKMEAEDEIFAYYNDILKSHYNEKHNAYRK